MVKNKTPQSVANNCNTLGDSGVGVLWRTQACNLKLACIEAKKRNSMKNNAGTDEWYTFMASGVGDCVRSPSRSNKHKLPSTLQKMHSNTFDIFAELWMKKLCIFNCYDD